MPDHYILVVEREPLIADDMREEILAMSCDAVVEQVASVKAAMETARRMPRLDLLIVSNRSTEFVGSAGYDRLATSARSVLLIGDAGQEPGTTAHVARTPFTSSSLRKDLERISVDGARLFPQRCRR